MVDLDDWVPAISANLSVESCFEKVQSRCALYELCRGQGAAACTAPLQRDCCCFSLRQVLRFNFKPQVRFGGHLWSFGRGCLQELYMLPA